jgi:hypothetical protein
LLLLLLLLLAGGGCLHLCVSAEPLPAALVYV